jgi:hypothetical protein
MQKQRVKRAAALENKMAREGIRNSHGDIIKGTALQPTLPNVGMDDDDLAMKAQRKAERAGMSLPKRDEYDDTGIYPGARESTRLTSGSREVVLLTLSQLRKSTSTRRTMGTRRRSTTISLIPADSRRTIMEGERAICRHTDRNSWVQHHALGWGCRSNGHQLSTTPAAIASRADAVPGRGRSEQLCRRAQPTSITEPDQLLDFDLQPTPIPLVRLPSTGSSVGFSQLFLFPIPHRPPIRPITFIHHLAFPRTDAI